MNSKLTIIILFFSLFTYSQSKSVIDLLENQYQQLLYCYEGEDENGEMDIIDIDESRLNSIIRINQVLKEKTGKSLLETYPVYFHLINHINFSLTTLSSEEACNELAKAIYEYNNIDIKYVHNDGAKTKIKKAYEKIGIDSIFFKKYYDSKYCNKFDITEKNCIKTVSEPISLEKGKIKFIKNQFIHKKLKKNDIKTFKDGKKSLEYYLFIEKDEVDRNKIYKRIKLFGNKNNNREDYPVYFNFIESLNFAILNKTSKSCEILEKTKSDYKNIDSIFPFIMAKAKKRQYEKMFSINLKKIEKTIESLGCLHKNEYVKTKKKTNVKETKFVKKSKFELLAKNVTKGLVKDSLFSLENVIDFEYLPITDSIFQIKIGNPKVKETIYFKSGSYTVRDNQSIASEKAFKNFQNTIFAIAKFITNVTDEYEIDSYQVFIQGSADKPTFSPKKTISINGADINTFKNIEVTVMNPKNKGLPIETYKVKNTYTNKDLPNLRAAYVKNILLSIQSFKNHPEKISIFDGFVKDYLNDKKRNAVIYIKIKESLYKK